MSQRDEDQKYAEKEVARAVENHAQAWSRTGLQLGKRLSAVSERHGGTLTEEELRQAMLAYLERALYCCVAPIAAEAPERAAGIFFAAKEQYEEASAKREGQRAFAQMVGELEEKRRSNE